MPSPFLSSAFIRTTTGITTAATSRFIDQNQFILPGLFFGGVATPQPTTPQPVSPPAPTNSVDLQLLLNAIPVAQEGHVITSEYHNALRSALLMIASQMGIDLSGNTGLLTLPPVFYAVANQPQWLLSEGWANPPEGGTARGWFPLNLPQGARIQSMTAIGRRTGSVTTFQVMLLRQPLTETDATTLITLNLNTASDPFQVNGSINVPGAGANATEEYRQVDNSAYKYLVTARVAGAGGDAVAQLNAIELAYAR